MKFASTMIAACVFIAGMFYLFNLHRVEAGYVGIKVDLLGTDKGVQSEEVGPGRYWIGINEDLFLFPTFSQNYVWTQNVEEGSPEDESLTFQSVEGMDIGADIGITYSVNPMMVSELFQRYRKGIDEITDLFLRNMVRDALVNEASKMRVNSIYGTGKTGLMEAVQESVKQQVATNGIIVEKIYWIGSLRLPPRVVEAIDSEIAANSAARQRLNEIESSKAEADKLRAKASGEADAVKAAAGAEAASITLRADAQAEANRKLAQSLTPELIEYMKATQWDGVLPQVTGGATPLIDMR